MSALSTGFGWGLGGRNENLSFDPKKPHWWTPNQTAQAPATSVNWLNSPNYNYWQQQQNQLAATRAARAASEPPKPGLNVMTLTKSPTMQSSWGDFMDRIRGNTAKADSDLAAQQSIISKTLTGNPAANAQEEAAILAYFNGDIRRQLDAIEQSRSKAIGDLSNRIAMETKADIARRQAAGGAGESSYLKALEAKSLGGIYAQAAEQDAAQKLANLQWLERSKADMLGRRLGLDSTRAALAVTPLQSRLAMERELQAQLAALQGIDLNNNFYGVWGDVPNRYGLERGFQTPS